MPAFSASLTHRVGGEAESAPGGGQAWPRSMAVWREVGSPELSQRRKRGLDLGAARLVPGRQLERGAERLLGLVDGEARAVGRDLEQDAARLAEIDRVEIVAVDLGGRRQAQGAQGR